MKITKKTMFLFANKHEKKNNVRGGVVGKVLRPILYAVFLIYCLSLLYPLIWMVYTSLKPEVEYLVNTTALPRRIDLENYLNMFKIISMKRIHNGEERIYDIFDMFLYTLIFSLFGPAWNLFHHSNVAYILTKYKNKFTNLLHNFGLLLVVFSIPTSMPATLAIQKAVGIYDNMIPYLMIIPVGCFSGFIYLMLRAAYKGISDEFMNAASIDGAGHYRIYFQIMLPMVFPAIVTQFVLAFFNNWSNYETFLVWLPSYPSLGMGLYELQGSTIVGSSMPVIMAGFTVVCIPTILLYFCTRSIISSNFIVGGIKE